MGRRLNFIIFILSLTLTGLTSGRSSVINLDCMSPNEPWTFDSRRSSSEGGRTKVHDMCDGEGYLCRHLGRCFAGVLVAGGQKTSPAICFPLLYRQCASVNFFTLGNARSLHPVIT
ncbi:hypothetical protein JOM56_013243 [Amanita muscaria]